MTVYLKNATRRKRLDSPRIRSDVERLLEAIGEKGSSVSLSFVGDAAIRKLNNEYRGKDTPTDVLSFPLYGAPAQPTVAPNAHPARRDRLASCSLRPPRASARGPQSSRALCGTSREGFPEGPLDNVVPERMLGDVVISVDTAARQARDYDATLDMEVRRLLIHGLLHLIGHDHERDDERAAMEREERRLARAIDLPWPY